MVGRDVYGKSDEYLRAQVFPARVNVEAVSFSMSSSRALHCQFP